MKFPLSFNFKLLAIASQIYVSDADGHSVAYVKQKLMKLKEHVEVFSDDTQTSRLFDIRADRVIDFSAKYNFADASGVELGSVRRRGMRSIWKASYEVFDGSGNQVGTISEENVYVKIFDSLLAEIPIIGMVTGYFLNPSYLLSRTDGTPIARLRKMPA
ncbi:MAG: hypothetical protein ACKN97_00015, partial [Acidobacteriota bacterium]